MRSQKGTDGFKKRNEYVVRSYNYGDARVVKTMTNLLGSCPSQVTYNAELSLLRAAAGTGGHISENSQRACRPAVLPAPSALYLSGTATAWPPGLRASGTRPCRFFLPGGESPWRGLVASAVHRGSVGGARSACEVGNLSSAKHSRVSVAYQLG